MQSTHVSCSFPETSSKNGSEFLCLDHEARSWVYPECELVVIPAFMSVF